MQGDESTLAESIDETLLASRLSRWARTMPRSYEPICVARYLDTASWRFAQRSPESRHPRRLAKRLERRGRSRSARGVESDRHVTFDDDAVFAGSCTVSMTTTRSSSTAPSSRSASTSTLVPWEKMCVIATSHEDARCRESAIAALGAIGDDRARPAILAALNDKPPVAPTRHRRTLELRGTRHRRGAGARQ